MSLLIIFLQAGSIAPTDNIPGGWCFIEPGRKWWEDMTTIQAEQRGRNSSKERVTRLHFLLETGLLLYITSNFKLGEI